MARPPARKQKLAATEWVPTSCPVCEKCLLNPRTKRCYYGGPFTGYRQIK